MKKLMRTGRHGKVVRMDKAKTKKLHIDFETVTANSMDLYLKAAQLMKAYGGKADANPFSMGPFAIKKITVLRKRQGKEVEVDQRWLVDRHERPILHGTRKQLDRQLKRYEMGFLKYLMTRGTKAEGI
jgi:hypothetical protein